MMGHCVAILRPIGTMFAGVNSKWPTAFTPALSIDWAPAFSMTPVMMQMKDIGFIVGRNRVFFAERGGAGRPRGVSTFCIRWRPVLRSTRGAIVSRLRFLDNHPSVVPRNDLHGHVLRQQL